MSDVLYDIIFVILAALIVVVQVFLSSRKNWAWGLIPVAAMAVAGILACTSFSSTLQSYNTELWKEADRNGNTLELVVRTDAKGNVVDFSDLQLRAKDGDLVKSEALMFHDDGTLEGELLFTSEQELKELLKGRRLTGASKEIGRKSMWTGEGQYYEIDSTTGVMLSATLPLLLVYLAGRLAVGAKKRENELKQMQIRSI